MTERPRWVTSWPWSRSFISNWSEHLPRTSSPALTLTLLFMCQEALGQALSAVGPHISPLPGPLYLDVHPTHVLSCSPPHIHSPGQKADYGRSSPPHLPVSQQVLWHQTVLPQCRPPTWRTMNGFPAGPLLFDLICLCHHTLTSRALSGHVTSLLASILIPVAHRRKARLRLSGGVLQGLHSDHFCRLPIAP